MKIMMSAMRVILCEFFRIENNQFTSRIGIRKNLLSMVYVPELEISRFDWSIFVKYLLVLEALFTDTWDTRRKVIF